MATTRIISMHINKGKNIAECLTDRIDYSKNPEKTQGGELISAWQCDPKTADAEFLFSKRQYRTLTGREQQSDVIAYQVRQSFKPGEITPEEANRIGYEFAVRFLKGKHAFIVATHTDKNISTIILSGTQPRWTANGSSGIFSVPVELSQGSVTQFAPNIGSLSFTSQNAAAAIMESGWVIRRNPHTANYSALL